MSQKGACPVCMKKGKEVVLEEKNDSLFCPQCNTSWLIDGKSPLSRYLEQWKKNSDDLFVLLRPELPHEPVLEPGLQALYEDCYQTLLIGRFNGAIVLMGLLLEALMKERIRLKSGQDFKGAYGACIKIIEEQKIIDPKDLYFLRKFKDQIRNPYAHFDESKIVEGRIVKGWEIPFDELLNPEKFEKTFAAIKSGERKPLLLSATHPALRSVVKLTDDRRRAIALFNQVYDFLLAFRIRYLRQSDYDEHNKK